MATVSIYHSLALLTYIFVFSDRFRTAINVFGDSIGCAIVQHLSRHELKALDDKRTSIDTNIIPTHPSNHVTPVAYDNPTFNNQSGAIPYDDEDNDKTIRKVFF